MCKAVLIHSYIRFQRLFWLMLSNLLGFPHWRNRYQYWTGTCFLMFFCGKEMASKSEKVDKSWYSGIPFISFPFFLQVKCPSGHGAAGTPPAWHHAWNGNASTYAVDLGINSLWLMMEIIVNVGKTW